MDLFEQAQKPQEQQQLTDGQKMLKEEGITESFDEASKVYLWEGLIPYAKVHSTGFVQLMSHPTVFRKELLYAMTTRLKEIEQGGAFYGKE